MYMYNSDMHDMGREKKPIKFLLRRKISRMWYPNTDKKEKQSCRTEIDFPYPTSLVAMISLKVMLIGLSYYCQMGLVCQILRIMNLKTYGSLFSRYLASYKHGPFLSRLISSSIVPALALAPGSLVLTMHSYHEGTWQR